MKTWFVPSLALSLVLSSALFTGLSTASARAAELAEFSPGAWRLADARCSNPAFVPSADEQAYRDAILSGATVDEYRFADRVNGQFLSRMELVPGISCSGISTVRIEYLGAGRARLHYGPTTWTGSTPGGGTSGGTTITCSGSEQDSTETVTFELDGDELAFVHPSDPACGQFRMIWRRF